MKLLRMHQYKITGVVRKSNNRAYVGLRHAIVITTKLRIVVKRTCNTEVRLGGDNNSVT